MVSIGMSCSWCDTMNTLDVPGPLFCRECGHRADVCRMDCDCFKCRGPQAGLVAADVDRLLKWVAAAPEAVTRYTTAPEAYDGFGTKTLAVAGWADGQKPIRVVSVDPAHLDWQEARYASGCYESVKPEDAPKYVNLGWALFPAPQPVAPRQAESAEGEQD